MLNSPLFFRGFKLPGWLYVICLLALSANAQTASSPTPAPAPQGEEQQTASPAPGHDTASDSHEESGPPPVEAGRTLDQPQVKELGGGGSWFSDNVSWLHWGPVGIRSANAFYTYSSQDNSGTPGTGTLSPLSTATFELGIAYDQRIRHSRLIWQYTPRVLMVDNQVSPQLMNQDSTFDLLFVPTSRLTVGVTDWFGYYGKQNILNDRTLDRNTFSGALMNPFLNNGQATLTNSVALPVTYNKSARTTFSISPFFSYAHVKSGTDINATPPGQTSGSSMYQYGARTQLSHNFSPNQSLGVFYIYQENQQKDFTNRAFFHSFGMTASRRVGRTIVITGQAGGSRSTESHSVTWTGVGLVTITKSFRRSSLQATYGRDATFSGLLGNGYSDYGWAGYNRQIGRRMSASAGFGYLSAPNLGQRARGKYVNGNIGYAFLRNLSWFFGYARFWQSGKGVQLGSTDQEQFQVGLRWVPARIPGVQ